MKPSLSGAAIFSAGMLAGATLLSLLPTGFASPVKPLPPAASSSAQEAQDTSPGENRSDTRTRFEVSEAESAFIRAQMVAYLVDLQSLNAGLAEGDRAWLQEIAGRHLQPDDPAGHGQSVRSKAPDGFRQISRSLRREFRALSEISGEAPIPDLQQQLSDLTSHCVACHASYAVSVTAQD